MNVINTTELDDVYSIYCQFSDLNLVNTIVNQQIKIIKLESWNQLLETNSTDTLFSDDDKKHIVYDIQNLALDAKSLKYIDPTKDVFIYNSSVKLLTNDKKIILQSSGCILEPPKLTKLNFEKFVQEYAKNLQLNLQKHHINSIVILSKNLFEIIDIVDYLYLSNSVEDALRSFTKDEKIPIFMLPLRNSNLKEDIKQWLPYINSEESQLIISLLFTKLDKQHSTLSQILLKQLISLDNQIKLQSRLDATLLLKLFIWKAQEKQIYEI